MVLDKNTITNIAGAVGAAAMAAGPVINSTTGSMDGNDWGKLITAVAIAILGWFTGKKEVVKRG